MTTRHRITTRQWMTAIGALALLSNGARLLGFVLAVVIMVVLPILAGSRGRLF